MYQEFSVVTIETLLNEKQIIVTTSNDININLFKDTVIEIYERSTKTPLLFDTEIQGRELIITLNEWPIPNSEHILFIKNLKSITEDSLTSNIKKVINFSSNIVSIVSIVKPVMYEQIDCLDIELKESADDQSYIKNSYYIEVSTDNAFINTIIKTNITNNIVKLSLPKSGQYFMRARVQENTIDDQYGLWSETTTFNYNTSDVEELPTTDIDDDMEPEVFIDEFKLLTELEQGVTPNKLVLEFSKDLDAFSLQDIIIIRKVVK